MDSANETSQQSSASELCREGCGFYAGPKMEGMCSVCYKKTLKKKNGNSLSGIILVCILQGCHTLKET